MGGLLLQIGLELGVVGGVFWLVEGEEAGSGVGIWSVSERLTG